MRDDVRPTIPPKPPTEDEIRRRDREMTSKIVARLSRGCAFLQRGQYMTAKDIEAKKREVFGDELEDVLDDR